MWGDMIICCGVYFELYFESFDIVVDVVWFKCKFDVGVISVIM